MSSLREMMLELGEAVADSFEGTLTGPIRIGRRELYDDELLRGRVTPLRVAHVAFDEGLSDALVFVTSLNEKMLNEAVQCGVRGIGERLGLTGLRIPEATVWEFETVAEAQDNLDALWQEPCINIDTASGQILVIAGERLLRVAERIMRGEATAPDEHAAAAVEPAGSGEAPASGADDRMPGGADARDDVELPDFATAGAGAAGTQAAEPAPIAPAPEWSELITGVSVKVSAELGQTDLLLGRVASLADGSIVTLDEDVDEPVRLYVNGSLYARARLVVVDGEYGVEIEEIVGSQPVASLGGRVD